MSMARSRFAVMTMTDRAAERARGLIANAGRPVLGLRVGVKNGGCAGMSYTVEFAEAKQPLDEVVKDKGVTLLVDSKALMFLLGTELDYETGKIASTFTFRNPNQVSACGCGESVQLTPAKV
jgi:iron-sulfur cluster assembly protein